MTTLLVQTQDELNKAIADGIYDLRIEHPLGMYLAIADDPGFWLTLRGNTRATLWGNTRATLWGNTRAELWENASATLRENASATLWENASATLLGNASATLWGNASAELARFTVAWLRSINATTAGAGQVIDLTTLDTDPEAWCEWHGVKVEDGMATLYKAVDANYQAGHGWGRCVTKYPVGESVTAPDWHPTPVCGRGLHLCATPRATRFYVGDDPSTRDLECLVRVEDIVPLGDKVKCREVFVVREVDIDGNPVRVGE